MPPRPTAMLYMPMRNVTTRRDDEQTGFTFDQPSSQLGSLDNPARIRALAIARTRSRAEIIATRCSL